MTIKFYDKHNIDELAVVDVNDNINIKNYIVPIIKNGLLYYIDNADAEMSLLVVNDYLFPIVTSNLTPKVKINSYICSPTTHYLDYAKDEVDLELKDKTILKNLSKFLLTTMQYFFEKVDFEKAIFVNNLLLSTNLYIDFDTNLIEEITDFLVKKFPDYPIIFKSVNENQNSILYEKLKEKNYKAIFSRQVYIFDHKDEDYKKKDSFKRDLKLKRKSTYIWKESTEIKENEYEKLKKLYDFLYINKYSTMNPQFNANYISLTIKNPIFTYKILTKNDEIHAVLGYIKRGCTITTPIVGYDTNTDQKEGLYRLAVLETIQDSIKYNYILNMSSGVSKYKMGRGAKPTIEFNMIYCEHLDKKQQIPWKIFEKLTNYAILPVMKKYGL